MPVTREEMKNKFSVWSLVPEIVKARLCRYDMLEIEEKFNEILFKTVDGVLLYRIHVNQ